MVPALTKAELRQRALAARAGVADRARREAAIQSHVADLIARHYPGLAVATYLPIRDEIDTRPGLHAHHGPLCLPVVTGAGRPLLFRRWLPGESLDAGLFGTSHPPANAPEITPRLILTPLAGFDRRGHRLGYGGGFYDRTLAVLRQRGKVMAVGIAFDVQQTPLIPAEATDVALDAVLTETGLHGFSTA